MHVGAYGEQTKGHRLDLPDFEVGGRKVAAIVSVAESCGKKFAILQDGLRKGLSHWVVWPCVHLIFSLLLLIPIKFPG